MKVLFPIFILFTSFQLFAVEKKYLCSSSDNDLDDILLTVNYAEQTIDLGDERKIYDIDFFKYKIHFKKLLSVRPLDFVLSKTPDYFFYNFDIKTSKLDVSLNRDLNKKFNYSCIVNTSNQK